jgi:hypothetical protein
MDKAILHCLLKEPAACLNSLQTAVNDRNPQVLFIRTQPAFCFLHGDSRYEAIVKQIGFPI